MTIATQLAPPFIEEARCAICWQIQSLRPDPREGLWLVCQTCYETKFEEVPEA